MIRIPTAALSDNTARALDALQAQIDAVPSYAERLRHARGRFEAENRSGNETFDAIRRTLGTMCVGACRCMYCEDSMACEVEHFRPKVFYPELVFVWLNYLYACSNCNRIKRSNFRILCEPSEYVDLVRRRNDAVVEPRTGSNVLIDPRSENPLHYLSLDLVDTFYFMPRDAKGTHAHARAAYTIECLKLNDRDYLTKARAEAYAGYRARLREYLAANGTAQTGQLANAISRCGHPVVWAEMKAQSRLIPDLASLFEAAPEAYDW